MRKGVHQQQPTSGSWTMGSLGNLGEGINAGIAVGADVDLMDDAWWGLQSTSGSPPFSCSLNERMPGAIIVNRGWGALTSMKPRPMSTSCTACTRGDAWQSLHPFIPDYRSGLSESLPLLHDPTSASAA